MEENENFPFLKCIRKPSQAEFDNLQKIDITSQSFTIGRGLKNSIVIPFLSISRTHCTLKKIQSHWYIEDNSTFGIEINKTKLGKGKSRNLSQDDIISLEPSGEFIFKFIDQSMSNDDFEIPKKRMKMEKPDNNNKILNDVKMKFEESQSYEIKHIEDKIQNAKQMQTTSMILKEQLQSDMNRKLDNLQSEFALQIENLKGEKNEVEKQKALLIEERDAQLANVKNEMESKIAELLAQIQKHNESETELLNENNSLKEKLWKEREEFLSELDRESTSKQEMLEKLESKIREQEEVRLKEKQELETLLKMETEQLRYAKEKELKELEEQKKLREKELQQELENIKKNLQIQMEQTEQEKVKAEQLLNEKIEQMKKFSTEEKAKIEQFELERKEMEKKHHEVEINAQKSLKELKDRVMERETQLAALAAERIEKQAEQSSEVISTLQEQLERVKKQLRDVETEKNTLLENICVPEAGEGTSKQTTLTEVGELMESELQCSICAELFVSAITLNCSHTFCKYCITMWKKKKMDCPICRSTIMSECKSLVLDTFIEKMVQNLTEEMKVKRQEMLKYREAEVTALMNPIKTPTRTPSSTSNARRRRRNRNTRNYSRTTAPTPSGTTTHAPSTSTSSTTTIPIVDLTTVPLTTTTTPTASEGAAVLARDVPQREVPQRDEPQRDVPLRVLPLREVPLHQVPLQLREVRRPLRTRPLPPPQTYRIVQVQRGDQTLMVVVNDGDDSGAGEGRGLVASAESRAPTSAGTDAATAAALEATGPPAAPSDSHAR